MSERDDRAERHGRVLTELHELGLGVARRIAAKVETAESDVQLERLALAFHRVSRCVRLTLALEERLEHERRRGFRDEACDRKAAVERRREQVDHAVTGQVYAEGEEAEALLKELDDMLDEQSLYAAFVDKPIAAVIARLRRDLGLAPLADNDPGDGLPVRAAPMITARVRPWPSPGPRPAPAGAWAEDDSS